MEPDITLGLLIYIIPAVGLGLYALKLVRDKKKRLDSENT